MKNCAELLNAVLLVAYISILGFLKRSPIPKENICLELDVLAGCKLGCSVGVDCKWLDLSRPARLRFGV